jgi:hypothetical protein
LIEIKEEPNASPHPRGTMPAEDIMPLVDALVLALIVVPFLVFAATLAWASER